MIVTILRFMATSHLDGIKHAGHACPHAVCAVERVALDSDRTCRIAD
jgi:hypothetical protein